MASDSRMMSRIARQLGPDLYTACVQNDIAQVKASMSNSTNEERERRIAAVLAAALHGATDVACYSMGDRSNSGVKNSALRWILQEEKLDPAYRFLVALGLVDVNHEIDRTGTMLGMLAGQSPGRHGLVEYMLQKGALVNDIVECFGNRSVLTVAAGYSDAWIVELLLDYGAPANGTGALKQAAARGKEENVRCLLARGANINETASVSPYFASAGSPLHEAVEYGHIAVIDMLLEAGTDVSLKDEEGRTAADIARQKGMDASVLEKLE